MLFWFRKQERRPARHARPAVRPALEVLETRLAPALLTVNTLQDGNPSNFLSLREAVTVVNNGSAAGLTAIQQAQVSGTIGTGDTIQFAVGPTGAITLTSGEIVIAHDVTIDGAGVVAVSGNASSRIFRTNATVSIVGLTLTDGQATGISGGAIDATGGSLSLTDCVLSNNHVTGSNGGAIESVGAAALTITGCTFTGNSADGNGGAIDSPGVMLTISDSTFDHNSSQSSGGAVSVGDGTVRLTNCTLTANSAANGSGGAVNSNFAANFTLLNCTVAANSAAAGGGVSNTGSGSFTLTDTIIADNMAAAGNDVAGNITSGDYNLVKDTSSGGGSFILSAHDLAGVDPTLGPLADNGGPTKTMALLFGSPAIGAGPFGGTLPGNDQLDQRGVSRTSSLSSDIGAFQTDANYFVVTNTNDSGTGSLRQAILHANSTPLLNGSPNVVQFDIPGTGVQVISPLTPLPTASRSADIDGYSQPGATPNSLAVGDNAVLLIRIDGASAGAGAAGLVLAAGNSTVMGLDITGFNGDGVVAQAANDFVAGNFIGIAPDGATAAGNGGNGVTLTAAAAEAAIGDGTATGRNVIAGNGGNGIVIGGSDSVLIQGNYLGTNAAGTAAVGNGGDGVLLSSAFDTTVGGTTAGTGNLISGNGQNGVEVQLGGTGDVLEGNFIGTDVSGTAALGNNTTSAFFGGGVSIGYSPGILIGGGAAGAGNLISGNNGVGVYLYGFSGSGNSVQGNKIGTDVTGTAKVGNTQAGIDIDNGASANVIGTNGDGVGDATEGNLISGNGGFGIILGFNGMPGQAANNNVIAGNFIGTNAAGTAALGNAYDGITVGIAADNRIGTNADGVSDALERNVISGNAGSGVSIFYGQSTGNVVAGNFIGTNVNGTASVANGPAGVSIGMGASDNIVGGTTAAARNVISGNFGAGVEISGSGTGGNVVEGNYVGLDAAGGASLGNSFRGVGLDSGASNNTVGGTAAGAGNVISGNTGNGVVISSGSAGNVVAGNFIGIDSTGAIGVGNTQAGVFVGTGAGSNIVGGTTAAARNVISGNLGDGVEVSGSGTDDNMVEGNYVGLNAAGGVSLGNGQNGVGIDSGASNNTVGGGAAGAGNVVSGNGMNGVEIGGGSSNQVAGNLIGTDTSGALVLGNAHDGVLLWLGAAANTVGGSGAAANLIAGNASNAIEINETLALATANQVQGLSRPSDTLTYVAQPGVTTTIDFSAGTISGPGVSNAFAGLSVLTLDANGGVADLQGGTFANEIATPTAADAGTVAFDGSLTVNYRSATQLQDTAPLTGTAIYNGTTAAEAIDVVDGGTIDGFQATRLDSGAAGTFAPVLFANKPAVVVNGVDGADTFTVNNLHPGAGLSLLTIQAGPAGSTFNVLTAAAGVSTAAVGGAGNDSFNVTAALAPGAVLSVDGGGGSNVLTFDAQGQHAVGTVPGGLTVDGPLERLTYANIAALNLDNTLAVDAIYGPDTADRGTALPPSLTADERFVEVLYLNALGRLGTLQEIDSWAALFGGPGESQAQSQAAIAAGIEGSAEARDHLVQSWYATFLGRQAQGGEELGWVGLLAGQTEEQVLSRILGSDEFYNRAQALGFGDVPDGNYVRLLYQVLLHRAGGSGEVAGWAGAVPGLDRQGVALALLQSMEQRTDLFEGYYNALLHRPDDPIGLDGWWTSTVDAHTARLLFESGDEFFTGG
jgi:titin